MKQVCLLGGTAVVPIGLIELAIDAAQQVVAVFLNQHNMCFGARRIQPCRRLFMYQFCSPRLAKEQVLTRRLLLRFVRPREFGDAAAFNTFHCGNKVSQLLYRGAADK